MRLRTRAFLLTFIPMAVVLGISFLIMQMFVGNTVRIGLQNSLRQVQKSIAQLRDENTRQNNRLLKSFSNNDDLKNAVMAFQPSRTPYLAGDDELATPFDPTALQSDATLHAGSASAAGYDLQSQLLEFGIHAGVDFLMVSSPDGAPLVGAVRAGNGSAELVPLFAFPQMEDGGLLIFRGEPYQTGTVQLTSHGNVIGSITLGERLKLSALSTSTVLLHHGYVMQSDIEKSRLTGIGQSLRLCPPHTQCTAQLNGVEWLTMPIVEDKDPSGWNLYSLINVDDVTKPVGSKLRRIFFVFALISLAITLACSVLWSRAIVQPIALMVSHLRQAGDTGKLPELKGRVPNIREIRELAGSYDGAATAVQKAQLDLHNAYVEFIYALANALDARDGYTAGHSRRVSDLSCTIAMEMKQSETDIERLRVGALLHDIGKIGIPDSVLLHPGKLTIEEFRTIKKHPLIGRRILQGIQGFAKYLPAIELHHENWDGTGYPKRQCGQETPLDARIIHVADAYDAMTSDRAYRKGMTHTEAMDRLAENAGTQFDPDVVSALFTIAGFARTEKLTSTFSPAGSPDFKVTVPDLVNHIMAEETRPAYAMAGAGAESVN